MATEMKGETHLGWEEMLIMSVWFQDYHGHGGEQRASGRQTLCVNVSCTPLIHNWDIVIIYISCLKTHLNNLKAHNPNLTSEQKCHKMLVKTSTDIKLKNKTLFKIYLNIQSFLKWTNYCPMVLQLLCIVIMRRLESLPVGLQLYPYMMTSRKSQQSCNLIGLISHMTENTCKGLRGL